MTVVAAKIHSDFRPQVEAIVDALASAYPRVEFDGVDLFRRPGDKSLGFAGDDKVYLNAYWFTQPSGFFEREVVRARAAAPAGFPPWHGHVGGVEGEVERLLTHEFGHLLGSTLEGYREFVDYQFPIALQGSDDGIAVSGYALTDADEWFAETFAAMRLGGAGSAQIGALATFLTRDEDPEDLPEIYARRDDAWTESDHPRVPKGSEGGGQFAKKGQVSTNVAEPLAAHKFKVAKGPSGLTVAEYKHESGLTVTITAPPADKKYSSGWEIKYAGQTVTGQGGKSLLAKLNVELGAPAVKEPAKVEAAAEKLIEQAVAPAPPTENEKKLIAHVYAQGMSTLGLEFKNESVSGSHLYEKGNIAVVVDPPSTSGNSDWAIYDQGKMLAMGAGSWALWDKLKPLVAENPAEKPKSFESEAHTKLIEAGFKQDNMAPWVYTKGESKIVINGETFAESWKASTPGKPDKLGVGAENLTKFLDLVAEGKPVWNVDFGTAGQPTTATTTTPKPAEPPKSEEAKPLKSGLAKKHPDEIKDLVGSKQYNAAYDALDAHAPHIMDSERDALSSYKGSGYVDMNECMRKQDNCTNSSVKKLEGWLAKAKTPLPLTLWRRVKGPFSEAMYSIGTPGMRWRERGFLSTSLDPGPMSGWGNLTMEIHAPAGMPGTTVSNVHESEVLFNRGIHLKIKSFDRQKKHMVVEMDTGED